MSVGVTAQQDKCLTFLRQAYAQNFTPTFEEIRVACGFGSKSGVHRVVHALKERGFIKLLPSCKRTIVLVDPHDALSSDELVKLKSKITGILARRRAEGEA